MRTVIFALVLALAGSACFDTASAAVAGDARKPALTKEQRRADRQRKISERATAETKAEVVKGRRPSYNRLLKSANYDLMWTEGLRYYNSKKKDKDYNSILNYTRAQNLFELVARSQTFAGTPKDDSLAYYYGCSFYKAGRFETSEQIFDTFRHNYPTSKFIEDAEYMYAMGFYFDSPTAEHDQSLTLRAMSAISEYMGRYPDTVKKAECEERMDDLRRKLYSKSFENAKLYYTIGQYKAAVRALNNAIDEFPSSPYREELMYLATRSAYMFARNSVPSQMTDRYMSMMDNYFNLVSEYPETRHLQEVERMRDEARIHIEAHTQQDPNTVTTQENGN